MLGRFFKTMHDVPLLRWPLLLFVILSTLYGGAVLFIEGGNIRQLNSTPQLAGTLIMFVLLPCYLVSMMIWQRGRILNTLVSMQDIVPANKIADVQHSLQRLAIWGWLLVAAGFWFGAYQNQILFNGMQATGPHALDIIFILGNCLLWATVAWLTAWRFPTSLALSRLGLAANVDYYQASRLRPLARIATTDVLIITGALALTPLQALDAEFRLHNYRAGFIVGGTAAVGMFLITLWGPHRKMQQLKAQRQLELEAALDKMPRDQISTLEPLVAHLDRVRTASTWPIDLQLLTRILVYVVVPPLAWVAAALVENLVDQF